MTTVDLHLHSTASDGTDSPTELLAKARALPLAVFAVTDHDTIDGAAQLLQTAPQNDNLICGAEFSCKTEAGKCHILGYGFAPDAPSMIQLTGYLRKMRRQKLEKRLLYLKETYGIVFADAQLQSLYALPSAGKPHIARLLIQNGYAQTVSEAIQTYLTGQRLPDERIDALRAIEAIRAGGGIAVWAHPLGGEGERLLTGDAFHVRLEALLQRGIQGLECFYSRYTMAQCAYLEQTTQEKGLCVSGGSDYHGNNKNIPMGQLNADSQPVAPERITLLQVLGVLK